MATSTSRPDPVSASSLTKTPSPSRSGMIGEIAKSTTRTMGRWWIGKSALRLRRCHVVSENAGREDKPMNSLPIRRVVLFKHGVGHFEREGQVNGDTALSLT